MNARTKRAPKAGDGRREITLSVREALLEESRSAVLALGAQGRQPSSLSQLFDAALGREMARLRRAHNHGAPFPRQETQPPGGTAKSEAGKEPVPAAAQSPAAPISRAGA